MASPLSVNIQYIFYVSQVHRNIKRKLFSTSVISIPYSSCKSFPFYHSVCSLTMEPKHVSAMCKIYVVYLTDCPFLYHSTTLTAVRCSCQGQIPGPARHVDSSSLRSEVRKVWNSFSAPPHTCTVCRLQADKCNKTMRDFRF